MKLLTPYGRPVVSSRNTGRHIAGREYERLFETKVKPEFPITKLQGDATFDWLIDVHGGTFCESKGRSSRYWTDDGKFREETVFIDAGKVDRAAAEDGVIWFGIMDPSATHWRFLCDLGEFARENLLIFKPNHQDAQRPGQVSETCEIPTKYLTYGWQPFFAALEMKPSRATRLLGPGGRLLGL